MNACYSRNGEVELLRITVAIIIVNFHSLYCPGALHVLPGGAVGVEFFFLLSGYLMARHIRQQVDGGQTSLSLLGGETLGYLWRRLRSFWPELLVSSLIGLAVFAWGHHFAIRPTMTMARDTVLGNILLLHMTGFAEAGVNSPAWYLCTLMAGSALLYPVLKRFGNSVLIPIAACFLLGYIMKVDPDSSKAGFAMVRNWMGVTYKGNIRGVAELAIGASLYPLAQMLAAMRVPRLVRAWLMLVKWGCYGVTLIYCVHPVGTWMPFVLVALACALVLNTSRVCTDADWYQYGCIMWLGRFSLPLYLSHIFWARNLNAVLPCCMSGAGKLLAYNLCSLATALLVMYSARWLRQTAGILHKR